MEPAEPARSLRKLQEICTSKWQRKGEKGLRRKMLLTGQSKVQIKRMKERLRGEMSWNNASSTKRRFSD